VIAIQAALLKRERTGVGDFCDVSMMDGAFSWLTIHAASFVATGEVPQRERMHLSGEHPCYRVYPAADGWLAVGALEPQFWATLCEVIERPDLADDAFAGGTRRGEVIAELEKVFSARTRDEWAEAFAGRDACVGPIKDMAEAFQDPQILARGMIVEADVPGAGTWKHVGNPIKLADSPDTRYDPPPGMGEHTAEVLGEIDVTEEELTKLRNAGVI
jgi:crotonobetainyl-CoA:carnitine CoA-transferase CaiB-like acyl-CoA transferase